VVTRFLLATLLVGGLASTVCAGYRPDGVEGFTASKAEREVSTSSTAYVTATTVMLTARSSGTHVTMVYLEIAGETATTQATVKLDVPELGTTVAEIVVDMDSRYDNGAWYPMHALCYQFVPASTYTMRVSYKSNNAGRTIYVRRVRAICFHASDQSFE